MFRSIVPAGASPYPFLMARVKGPLLESPDGKTRLQVWFNDAGAAHSGNHWTWIVRSHWLLGGSVVAQGYLGGEQAARGEPVPARWTGERSLSITFLNGRYSGDQAQAIVRLD